MRDQAVSQIENTVRKGVSARLAGWINRWFGRLPACFEDTGLATRLVVGPF